ncbi:MAG: ankyrin repeat domain-containing protein [Verrucomicrobiaceae bacterium]|nr:MAG: ankyrin repeat domain-containing protein [Verrucomicrobiaceae bacterium]
MKTIRNLLLLAGISGWIVLFGIVVLVFTHREDLRATRYWALDRAAVSGDESMVRFLLALGADPTGDRDYKLYIDKGGHNEFSSPICQAAWYGRTEIVRRLLEAGANPNIKEGEGWTPFLAAADRGHKETVILLLQSGADSSIGRPDGISAAEYARKHEDEDIASVIEQWKK